MKKFLNKIKNIQFKKYWQIIIPIILFALSFIIFLITKNFQPKNIQPTIKESFLEKDFILEQNSLDELIFYSEIYLDLVNKEKFSSQVGKEIQKNTNVFLKTIQPIDNFQDDLTKIISEKNFPDLIFASKNLDYVLEKNIFIDLKPLIEKYGENIKKLYGQSLLAHENKLGKIYFLGSKNSNNIFEQPISGFKIQHEVLKEFNYPEIKTIEEYINLIKKYKEKYPTINYQPTIGISLITGGDWKWTKEYFPSSNSVGLPNDGDFYINPETYEATYKFYLENYKEYFYLLNNIYNEGLLDPESFIQSHEEYIKKISSGRVLGLLDNPEQYYLEGEENLTNKFLLNRTYGIFPLTIKSDYNYPLYRKEDYIPLEGIGITKYCKDPVLAIKFIDYLCSEEGQILINWGIENTHWTIENNNRVFLNKEINIFNSNDLETVSNNYIKTGIGLYNYPWPSINNEATDNKGYLIIPSRKSNTNYSSTDLETLSRYNKNTYKDFYLNENSFKNSSWGNGEDILNSLNENNELYILNKELNIITENYLPKLVVSSKEDFNKLYEEFKQKLLDNNLERTNKLMSKKILEIISYTQK